MHRATIINPAANASLFNAAVDRYWGTMSLIPSPRGRIIKNRSLIMLKFLASTVGIIFLIGLAVVIGLLMLIF